LSIRVIDSSNPQCAASAQYTLTPRDTCWLAYVSTDQGRAKLPLFDPVLQDYQSSAHRLTFPNTPGEEAPVSDFKFSPNGRYLAYQLNGTPARLMLLMSPAWQESPLVFQVDSVAGSVAYYAWSPDSSTLAVAFTANDDAGSNTYLGGVHLSQSSNPADAGSSGNPPSIDYLVPIPADVQSELVWFGNGRFVAYHAPSVGGDEFPHLAQLAQNQFISDINLASLVPYTQSLQLVPTDSGFWAIDPYEGLDFWNVPQDVPQITYWNVNPYTHARTQIPDSVLQARDSVLAPNGAYVLRKWPVDAPVELRLYGPTDVVTLSPLATAQDCPTFLAWSPQAQRLACVSDSLTASTIHFYDLSSSTPPSVTEYSLPDDQYKYRELDAYPRRRAFSPDGNWFVFASAEEVYIATLAAGSPLLLSERGAAMLGDTDHVDFAFSPDEHCLLEHRGYVLKVHRLDYLNPYVLSVDTRLAEPAVCTSVFLDNPSTWCGTVNGSVDLAWSPDSRWASYLTADRNLQILDLSGLPEYPPPSQVNNQTESDCKLPMFQPQDASSNSSPRD